MVSASTEEAIKLATKAGLKVLVMGTSVYAFTDQFAKLWYERIRKKLLGKDWSRSAFCKNVPPNYLQYDYTRPF